MKAVWKTQVIAEADKDTLIYIEGNWYFPPSSIKIPIEPRGSDLEGVQGAAEKRTETYQEYVEGASQGATPQSAESAGQAGGSADGQDSTVRLRESDTPYTCPWKGACQYFDVGKDDNYSKDVAFSYPEPKPSAIDTVKKDFSNYVAFWRDIQISE